MHRAGWCIFLNNYVHMSQFVETCNSLIVPVVSLEDKSNTAVVNGTSHEESCMSQQVVQHGFLPEFQLGKRKIQDDFVRAEIRSQNLLCDKMEMEYKQSIIAHEQYIITHKMENEKKIFDNRMSTVNKFAATMDLLDPEWRQDKKLMVQAQDYVKNAIFIESSTLVLENGGLGLD